MLNNRYKPAYIIEKFGIKNKKLVVHKVTIKEVIHRQCKLNEENIKEIVKINENKTKSNTKSRKIGVIMNGNLKGRSLQISRTMICIFWKNIGKNRKKNEKTICLNCCHFLLLYAILT